MYKLKSGISNLKEILTIPGLNELSIYVVIEVEEGKEMNYLKGERNYSVYIFKEQSYKSTCVKIYIQTEYSR